jgi:hypothetical protein
MGAVATKPAIQASPLEPTEAEDESASSPDRTLADMISAAWDALGSEGRTACPVCGDPMRLGDRDAGRCEGCGSELS